MQFNLKTALFWMAAIALLSGATAPFVRKLAPEEQRLFVGYLAATGAGCGLAIGICALLQRRTEWKFGRRLLLLDMRRGWSKRFSLSFWLGLFFGAGISCAAFKLSLSDRQHQHGALTDVLIRSCIWTYIIIKCWRAACIIELRNQAIFIRWKKYRWEELRRVRWNEATSCLSFVFRLTTYRIDVLEAERAEVSVILEQKCREGALKDYTTSSSVGPSVLKSATSL